MDPTIHVFEHKKKEDMTLISKTKSYQNCIEIMRSLVESGYTNQVSLKGLNVAITLNRGGDPRTLNNWRNTLERLGFIQRVNTHVFRLEVQRVPELLNVVVKRGQKKLM